MNLAESELVASLSSVFGSGRAMSFRRFFRHWIVGLLATIISTTLSIAVLAVTDGTIGLGEVLFGSLYFGLILGGPVGVAIGAIYAFLRVAIWKRRIISG
ncbi:hypothetical protein EF888_01450 [Silicimonas algicola]|uniref:Uncharacterized protein n=1 Tax=Silicimonas algicola TaxID=1826607 RepID=A0A316FLV2_9RHOB|nr:hypothetical protein [Silicimonas algicola]AZQ65913.1 hypothetical protein EF888_01450 [Silicimonas algicola]PWK49092.1 hypothetical protein C8D95_1232 [Silicimonas algicola]